MAALVDSNPALPSVPAILIQGNADKVVRPINQQQLERQFKILNRIGENHALPAMVKPGGRSGNNPYRIVDYRIGRKVMLRVCDIAHLEHAWSGGDDSVPYSAATGPDASRMMWDFFSKHRR